MTSGSGTRDLTFERLPCFDAGFDPFSHEIAYALVVVRVEPKHVDGEVARVDRLVDQVLCSVERGFWGSITEAAQMLPHCVFDHAAIGYVRGCRVDPRRSVLFLLALRRLALFFLGQRIVVPALRARGASMS